MTKNKKYEREEHTICVLNDVSWYNMLKNIFGDKKKPTAQSNETSTSGAVQIPDGSQNASVATANVNHEKRYVPLTKK